MCTTRCKYVIDILRSIYIFLKCGDVFYFEESSSSRGGGGNSVLHDLRNDSPAFDSAHGGFTVLIQSVCTWHNLLLEHLHGSHIVLLGKRHSFGGFPLELRNDATRGG